MTGLKFDRAVVERRLVHLLESVVDEQLGDFVEFAAHIEKYLAER